MEMSVGLKNLFRNTGLVVLLIISFVRAADAQPQFDSMPVTTGVYNGSYNYSIQTSGDQRMVSLSGTLPAGLSFSANVDGSALITGTATEVGDFPLTLTVTHVDPPNDQATQSFTLKIDQATPTITWPTPSPIQYGTALSSVQLNATTPVVGTFNYSPAAGTILSVGNGHVLSLTFTPDDAVNYKTVTGITVSINVTKATPVLNWLTPDPIVYGTPLGASQLRATASTPGTFTYTPAAGVILGGGNGQTLSVDFVPDDAVNFSNVTGFTTQIDVQKATPTINWSDPPAIDYGTALSGVQLNATSPVTGTFTYTPPSGTVLDPGANQQLKANFTPGAAESANYTSVNNITVFIDVNIATPSITWANPSPITYGTALSATQLNATASVPGTFVYTPASGTVLAAGTGVSLRVDFTPTDQVHYSATSKTVTIDVNKTLPVITWANPSDITYGTQLTATQLNATASVAGSFVYTPPLNTVLNAGTNQQLKVDFTPTDLTNYSATSKTVSINVGQAVPVVTWSDPTDITYGTALSATQLNATTSVPGTLTYTPALGTVLTAGTAKALKVDFAPTDNVNYSAVAGTTVHINVNKATPTFIWPNPSPISYGTALSSTQLNASPSVPGTFVYTPPATTVLNSGNNQLLSASFTPTDAANYNSVSGITSHIDVLPVTPGITWSTPTAISYGTALTSAQLNAVASVPGTYVYSPPATTILNAGPNQTLSVTFTPTDNANYNVQTANVTITVNKAVPVITWNNPSNITYGTALSATQLNATFSTAGTSIYTPAAGTVLNAGTAQPLKVDFTPTDATNYTTATKTVSIDVGKATPTVSWTPPSAITYGAALTLGNQLNATASVAGTFSYAPGDGTVLNAGPNQALSVNFTPTDATNYNSVNGTQVLITVNKATPTVSWTTPSPITYLTPLSATQLNATANTAGTFVYTPAAGTVLSAGAGQSLQVSFTPSSSNYSSVPVTNTTITVNKADPVITWANPTAITYGTTLSATQLNASSSTAGTFVYSPAAGTLLNAGAGQTLSTTFAPTDAANFNSVGKTATITVNKATPSITWPTPSSITYGTALTSTQLNASSPVAGTFAYAPSLNTVLNAGINQPLIVNFTPTDASNYNAVNGTQVLITVTKATPIITWGTPLPIKVGVALSSTQLNASANTPGSFVYTPPSGTMLAVGTHTLSADFTPSNTSNYNSVNGTTVSLTVSNKDNPVITWSAPSPISYGTTLSATQLNATADVPGSFVYTPAVGTLLSAGVNQTLSVTFTPTDAVTYNTVASNVNITVNKATLTATAVSTNRIYGAANPSFTVNYSGFVNSETATVIDTPPTATCSAIASSSAGSSFPIVPAGGVDNNYAFSYVNGSLTINKASLVAKPDDKSRSYGLPNPTFTISYVGFVNGDVASTSVVDPTASSTATTLSSVNTYPITLSGGSSSNYSLVLQSGTLTINPSPLQAKANDQVKIFGAANPALTISYSGFLNGDNAASITQPSISTTATNLSSVGTYPITLSGGSATNYTLLLLSGTLTVDKAPLTAKADDKSKVYGQATPPATISYTGFVNGNTAASITQPTLSGPGTTATATTDAGIYAINLSGGSAANYDLTLQNGSLTISQATPVITWNDPAAIDLGTPLSATQLNATSSVPGGFIYTPPAGTVLSTGANQPLKADFTPANTNNYVAVNGTTVHINVNVIVPTIASFSPTAGTTGTTVTITGTNFDLDPSSNIVKFNGTSAFVTGSTSTTITAVVPVGATSGSIQVTRLGQTGTSSSNFTVIANQPTAQPTNLVFSQILTSSLTGSFTAATGNPTGYLVVRKASSAMTGAPVTGTSYVLGAALGGGVVVHLGNTTSFNDSGLSLNTEYFYTIFSYNGTGASSNYLTANPLAGSQKTLLVVDLTAPTVTANLSPASGELNSSVVVSANFQDNESGIVSAKIKFRAIVGGGSAAFTTATMSNAGDVNYKYTLPIVAATDLGIEYKFQILNGVGMVNTDTAKLYSMTIKHVNGLPVSTYPASAAGSETSNYRIISVPLVLDQATANGIFSQELGEYDPTNWRMFQYNGSSFDELNGNTNLTPGKGYWFISREGKDLKTDVGSTVNVTTASPFTITLQPGWNQIGNPYPFKISWSDVIAANPGQLQNLGGAGSKVRVFRGAQSDEDVLSDFEGGFVKYLGSSATAIVIPVVKKNAIQGRFADTIAERQNDINNPDWEVLFKLTIGKSEYNLGGVGMSPQANDDFDYFDNFNSPRFIDYLEIRHPKKYAGMSFTKDIVLSAAEHVWSFAVESNLKDPNGSLRWENIPSANGKELYLLDVATQHVTNMLASNHYEFDRSVSKEFRVIYGDHEFTKEALVPERAVLFDPYPNPFTDSATITYSLPKGAADQVAALAIYDANGIRVSHLEVPSHEGTNTWTWDSRQQSPGLYLVRLSVGNETVVKKILKR